MAVRAEAEKRARDMSFLVDLGRALASTLDLEELLAALVERLTRDGRVEAVRVFLSDEATGDLVLRAARGGPEAAIGSRVRPGEPDTEFHPVPLGKGEDAGGVLAVRKPGGAPLDADEQRLGASNLQRRISEAKFPTLAGNVSYRLNGDRFASDSVVLIDPDSTERRDLTGGQAVSLVREALAAGADPARDVTQAMEAIAGAPASRPR